MVSGEDRRAAWFLLGLAAVGALIRWWSGGDVPGAVGYHAATGNRPVAESVAVRAARLAEPLRRGERIDVNRADARELTRLPRIGPALAARIVASREELGGFRQPEDLERVPGIGPALRAALTPHVRFGPTPRPRRSRPGAAETARISLNRATAEQLTALPGIGPARAQAIVSYRMRHGPFASVDDLIDVPGIGPGTVNRLRGRVSVP